MLKHNTKSLSISVEAPNIDKKDVDEEDAIIPCSVEEVESHLRAFIGAFVRPEAQPRWLEFLIERRSEWDATPRSPRGIRIYEKAQAVLQAFAADDRYCVRIPNGQRIESYYVSTFGRASGVYFATGTAPCKLTATKANAKFSHDAASAMLSFQAGRQALLFCHDGGVWRCEKVPPPVEESNRETIKAR